MKRTAKRALVLGALALAATAEYATMAAAQSTGQTPATSKTPSDWPYDLTKNNQRVPKPSNRVTNPDGSWREEVQQGKCLTIKEKTATGEYREARRCNPK